MNRTVRVSVLMSFALCLLAGEKALAQFSEESVTRRWEKLPDGVQILKLWTEKEYRAGELQIVILRMTNAQHEKFVDNMKNYLQTNRVFGEQVTLGRIISYANISEPEARTKTPTRKSKSGASDPWTIVAEHNAYCDSAIIEYDGQ